VAAVVSAEVCVLPSDVLFNAPIVSYRWSFETIAVSRVVVAILCVKHLAKHIPTENALIPIFVF